MEGYPKTLNTKADYEYVLENYPDLAKDDLHRLLDASRDWFFVSYLDPEDPGIVNDTHKVLEQKEGEGEGDTARRAQYEFRINPTCKLIRMGFTVEEVEDILLAD